MSHNTFKRKGNYYLVLSTQSSALFFKLEFYFSVSRSYRIWWNIFLGLEMEGDWQRLDGFHQEHSKWTPIFFSSDFFLLVHRQSHELYFPSILSRKRREQVMSSQLTWSELVFVSGANKVKWKMILVVFIWIFINFGKYSNPSWTFSP